jgi:hypothetical protein
MYWKSQVTVCLHIQYPFVVPRSTDTITAAQVQSQVRSGQDLWWTKWHGGRFSLSTLIYPVTSHSTVYLILISLLLSMLYAIDTESIIKKKDPLTTLWPYTKGQPCFDVHVSLFFCKRCRASKKTKKKTKLYGLSPRMNSSANFCG